VIAADPTWQGTVLTPKRWLVQLEIDSTRGRAYVSRKVKVEKIRVWCFPRTRVGCKDNRINNGG
jgi:hypothetical protein